MRPLLPTAVVGPGVVPPLGGTPAGINRDAGRVIGSSGRAAFITARTLTVNPGDIEAVPLTVDIAGFTAFNTDIMRVSGANDDPIFIINNNGVLFVYRGLTVLDNNDAQPKFHVDQADGGIEMGDGTNPADWTLTRTAADTASLGAGDRLLGVLASDLVGGYAAIAKFGTD